MSLRHALLGLLSDGEASGYDLAKRMDSSAGFAWSASHTQIYPELVRMADAGLVEVAAEGPRGRKEYRLTGEGLAELRRWLTDEPPDRNRRDESLLRVFFLGVLEPREAGRLLEEEGRQWAAMHERLVELDAAIPWDASPSDRFGRIALERGLRHSAAMAEWARWAAQHAATPAPRLRTSR